MLHTKNHPIVLICDIFRSEFEKAYRKYSQPVKDETTGVQDKLGVMEKVRERTLQLKQEFQKLMTAEGAIQNESVMDSQIVDANEAVPVSATSAILDQEEEENT